MAKAPGKSVAELLVARLGTLTSVNTALEVATLGTTAAALLRGKPHRVAFLLVNLSVNVIYVAPDPAGTPSASNGIRLNPNGGSLSLRYQDDFDLVTYPWAGIADAAASAIFGIELLTAQ